MGQFTDEIHAEIRNTPFHKAVEDAIDMADKDIREEEFSNYLDSAECEDEFTTLPPQATEHVTSMLRRAFIAGWRAANKRNGLPQELREAELMDNELDD